MIRDANLQFSSYNSATGAEGDTWTTAATAAPSTNVIDLAGPGLPASASGLGGSPGRDMGIGDDPALKIRATVAAAFVGGTNAQVLLQGAPDNGSGSPGTYVTMATGPLVVTANLGVGAALLDIDMPRPAPGQAPPRFLRLAYTTTGTFTAGGLLIGEIVIDRQDQVNTPTIGVSGGYPAGIYITN